MAEVQPVEIEYQRLSGSWTGDSVTPSGATTAWKDTALAFHPSTEGDGEEVLIKGAGSSQWRGREIRFTLRGTWSPATGEVRLHKQHIGLYTNSVSFVGTLDAERRTLAATFATSSGEGQLHLAKDRDVVASPSSMTGVWEGTSVSRSNDPTHWCDTELLFSLTSDTKGSVFGRGVSLWRHRSISFEIVGQFDLAAMEVQLRKRHTGMYTNTVSYEGTIVETCGAAGAPVVQISGTYASGEFALTRVRGLADAARAALSAQLSAALAADAVDAAERRAGSAAPSSGTAEGKKADLDALVPLPPDAVVLARGTSVPGSESAGECSPAPDSSPIPPHGEHSSPELSRPSSPFTSLVSWSTGEVEKALTGLWSGASVDRGGLVTRWDETALVVSPHGSLPGRAQLVGRGVSLWQSRRIQFDLLGTVDWATGAVRLTKQHRGMYTNTINYSARLLLVPASRYTGEAAADGRSGDVDGKSKGCGEQDSKGGDVDEESKGGGAAFAEPSPSQPQYRLIIDGHYATSRLRGHVRLQREKVDVVLSQVGACGEACERCANFTPLAAARAAHSGSASGSGSSLDLESEQGPKLSHRLQLYRLLLTGLLADGGMTPRKVEVLEKYRNAERILDDEHTSILDTMGITLSQFQLMREHESSEGASSDLCKICYVEIINTVLLPCGHFCACRSCANQLSECPLCRSPVAQVQPIYRA